MKNKPSTPRLYEYRPIGYHLNDFTIIRKDRLWHLFHITGRGPKWSAGLCNEHLALGHATTEDFIHWTEQPHIPETHSACYAVKHKDRYALISNHRGVCWSRDLFHWSKEESLRFSGSAERWYDRQNKPEEARYISPRDPFITKNPENGKYVMFFCDRTADGDVYNRGCVGAAESADLVHWTYLPPVFGPKYFYCESPHMVPWDGKYHLFFSLSPEAAVRHAVSERLLGPYQELGEGDILPPYHGAGDAIETIAGRWLYFGRIMEREERRIQGRLMPGRLSLPVEIGFRPDDRVAFAPYRELAGLRGKILLDGFQRRWQVHHGDWKLNLKKTQAQNLYTTAPAGAVLGSAYGDDARLDSTVPVGNFDLACRFQLPTFATASMHFRAGLILRGHLRLDFDACLQTALLSDATGTVVCTAPLRDFQLDRYYDLRVIYLGDFIQVYLDNRLLMYLCAYGPQTGPTSLVVWQGDAIFTSLKIYEMPGESKIPVVPGGEPLRPELP